jgi:hypothetical protein
MPNAAPAPAPPITTVAPEVNVLTSANPLPAEVAAYEQWRTGLAARNIQGMTTALWPVDCVTEDDKVAIAEGSTDEFLPVIVYTHHGCNGRVDNDQYRAEATATLDAKLASFIAYEMWTGATTGNPSFQSTAFDLSSVIGSFPLATCISILMQAFSEQTSGLLPTIHAPISVLHELTLNNLVVRNGNRLETILGSTVMLGPGYPASTSTAPEGSAEPPFGSVYIYATGPVEIGLGPVTITGTDTSPGGAYARQNLVEFYAERQAIYRFPANPVIALQADVFTVEGGP